MTACDFSPEYSSLRDIGQDEGSYSNLPPAAAADSSSAQARNSSSSASGAAAEDYSSSSDDGLGDLTSEERLVLERRRHAELMLVAKFDKVKETI